MPANPLDRSYIALSENTDTLHAGLPVLTYHKVARRPRGVKTRSIYLSHRGFAAQIRELARAGFSSTTLDTPRPEKGNPARQVIITFDDGYTNVLENAAPTLARHRFIATQFLVAGLLGENNRWDVEIGEVPASLMDARQVREWLALGHDIGAHTLTHPHLTRLPAEAAREEISASKKKLEDLFSRQIRHFCYPYGEYDERIIDLVREAGYATACTTRWGANNADTPALTLHRLNTRYRSRNLRNVFSPLLRLFRP
jgi:peptidoglycan/xylan/chitin deacetylase (PgdA/CDA1 family)